MAGKCEHGLTTAECLVCASPRYGVQAMRASCMSDDLPAPVAWRRDGNLTASGIYDDERQPRGWEPLYTRAALDAVRTQERERCARAVEDTVRMVDAADALAAIRAG